MTSHKLLSLFFCALSLLAFSLAAEHGEGGGETSSEGAEKVEPLPPCARPLDELHRSIEQIFGDNYTVYINCLSFNEEGLLRVGVASGQSHNNGPDRRYVIECRGEILVALPQEIGSGVTIDNTTNMSCVECNTSLSTGVCTERCDPKCERCYESATHCTRCTACVELEAAKCTYQNINAASTACAVSCPGNEVINHELYNHCECRPPNYILLGLDFLTLPEPSEELEIECHDGDETPIPYGSGDMCVTDCNGGPMGLRGDNETGVCWACGLPYCVRCDGATKCEQCVDRTVLYEHECLPCRRAEYAVEAIHQEEELHEEEEEKAKRTIELAVTLPIISVLIIVFFVSMSVFAHHRYPHVSYHGHKRHRKPPTEEREPSPGVSGDDQPPQMSHVWRPRPTIVLR